MSLKERAENVVKKLDKFRFRPTNVERPDWKPREAPAKSTSKPMGKKMKAKMDKDEEGTTERLEYLNRAMKVAALREVQKARVTKLRKVDLLAQLAAKAEVAAQFQKGTCEDLAYAAYKAASDLGYADAQIMEIPNKNKDDDFHAFVTLGLKEKWTEPTDIDGDGIELIIIDLWMAYNHTGADVVEPIFEDIHDWCNDANSAGYDTDLCTTFYPK